MPQVAKMSWPYIAGFFDADGSITFHSKSGHVYLVIAQKEDDAMVLDEIREFLEDHEVFVTESSGYNKTTKCQWTRIIVGRHKDAEFVLNKLRPHLRNKALKCKIALEVIKTKRAEAKERSDTCKFGHKRTKESTYINPKDGKKSCNICRQMRARGLQPG